MFLALKELKYSKMKFALIIAVIVLISYLVYFLTSLAYGLASSYTNAIEKWNSDEIIMTVDANDSIMMSFMDQEDYDSVTTTGTKAKLGLFPGVINDPTATNILDTRVDVFFFGIDNDSFLKPISNLTLTANQVIADEDLQKQGYRVGDIFGVSGSTQTYEIIGFSKKTTYQTAPVIYMSLDAWQQYRYNTPTPPDLYSGIIIRGESSLDSSDSGLLIYKTKDYISTLPGYTAQVLTFTTMIVFLIIIVAFVLGIFIYVLTIQKTSMFGVMKAQGISNVYIGGSVVLQTFFLVLIGLVIGGIFTLLTGIFLADIVPFAVNIGFYVVITLAFFLFAFFGALFSVSAVLKIDPLKAIGG